MKADQYSERRLEIEGWPVNVTSYSAGGVFHVKVDNVQPGAAIARAEGATREEAERKALDDARRRLARTRRQPV
jgi:hypothetical protein